MPREREGYRENLEELNKFFPDRNLLSEKNMVQFTGRDRDVVKHFFTFKENYIRNAEAARAMST